MLQPTQWKRSLIFTPFYNITYIILTHNFQAFILFVMEDPMTAFCLGTMFGIGLMVGLMTFLTMI